MVGGKVIEILDCGDRLWVNCRDTHCYRRYGCQGADCKHDECAVYVERNDLSINMSVGDTIWWQGGKVMWTPASFAREFAGKMQRGGVHYDIQLKKLSCSGVRHPAETLIRKAFEEDEV